MKRLPGGDDGLSMTHHPPFSTRQPHTPKGRVLVVDDEPAVARGLRYTLRGYELRSATSVDEAITLLQQDADYDLVLIDIMMPGKLGVELRTWIAERLPRLLGHTVLMTGGITNPVVRQAVASADVAVLTKPFDSQVLRQLVQVGVTASALERVKRCHAAPSHGKLEPVSGAPDGNQEPTLRTRSG